MFPLTDVVVWDDHNELLLTSKRFASDVKKILLTHNRCVSEKVFFFVFAYASD